MTDDPAASTPRKIAAAEEAEAWLKNFDAITVEEIHAKYRALRAM